jgi:hypothetical protein
MSAKDRKTRIVLFKEGPFLAPKMLFYDGGNL